MRFFNIINIIFLICLAINNIAQAGSKKDEQAVEKAPTPLLNKEGDNQKTTIDIYYSTKTDFISTTPHLNMEKKNIPLVINFPGDDSCYVSCLTDNPAMSNFSHKYYGNIVGMIKVKGNYDSNFFCNIYGVEYLNYQIDTKLSETCSALFNDKCPDTSSCYVSGNTGKLFIKY